MAKKKQSDDIILPTDLNVDDSGDTGDDGDETPPKEKVRILKTEVSTEKLEKVLSSGFEKLEKILKPDAPPIVPIVPPKEPDAPIQPPPRGYRIGDEYDPFLEVT